MKKKHERKEWKKRAITVADVVVVYDKRAEDRLDELTGEDEQ